MASAPRLSVLDLSPVSSGSSAGEALWNTVDLARLADRLGFTRYWLAEHHNAASLASSSPEILMGQVAAATVGIRVGSGGVMLPNHSPLRVAESFRVLEALFPGRIDLGLGRAPGTDPRTALLLRRSKQSLGADDFPEQLDELSGYLDEGAAPRSAYEGTTRAIPTGGSAPRLWILGSSEAGGRLAARRGLGFAFAHHINPPDAVAVLRAYREEFRPSARLAAPEAIVAVSVVCAETDARAEVLASSARLSMLRFVQGLRDLPIPSVEEAMGYRYDPEERALLGAFEGRTLVGGPERVHARLCRLVEASGADEVMVLSHVHEHAARLRSYELLASAFDLLPRTAPAFALPGRPAAPARELMPG